MEYGDRGFGIERESTGPGFPETCAHGRAFPVGADGEDKEEAARQQSDEREAAVASPSEVVEADPEETELPESLEHIIELIEDVE